MTSSTPSPTMPHGKAQPFMVRSHLVTFPARAATGKSSAGLAAQSPSALDSIGSLLKANGFGTGRRGFSNDIPSPFVGQGHDSVWISRRAYAVSIAGIRLSRLPQVGENGGVL